jgi:hypothetical protein
MTFHAPTAFILGITIAGVTACEKVARDPSVQKPVQASETSGAGQIPPAAIQPAPSIVPAEVRATHAATRIALTPLSRVRREGQPQPSLDLRIEALDASGGASRMAGELRVVVRAPGGDPEHSAFDVAMVTEPQQVRHFDETLGIYVVRVDLKFIKPPSAGAPLEVSLNLTTPMGSVLEASGTVRW